jgi:hypothetical protein
LALKQLSNLKSDSLTTLRDELNSCVKRASEGISRCLEGEHADEQITGLDHGVVSFLHVRSALQQTGRPELIAKYKSACSAIRKHNLHLPICMASEPLSGLLVICDELQEWERPRMSGRALAQHVRCVGRSTPIEVPQAVIAEALSLAKTSINDKGRLVIQDKSLTCSITYRYPEEGKFWPQIVCIKKCHTFQRIDPSGFPLLFCIRLVNPYQPCESVREYGLEALRNYALRHPESGLLNLFDGREHRDPPVDFSAGPGPIETVTIDFERLHRIAPLPVKLDIDWDEFTRWPPLFSEPYDLEPSDFLRELG